MRKRLKSRASARVGDDSGDAELAAAAKVASAELEAAKEAATERRSSLAKKGTSFVKSFKNFMHLDHARTSRKS